MRKPKGHFSRAAGVVLEILSDHKGGTFFEAQGYWEGIQEPVIYIMISSTETPRRIMGKVVKNLKSIHRKLLQQEVFLKVNGESFIGRVIPEEEVESFPQQWEYDDDLRQIAANKSRKNEDYKLVFGRKEQANGKHDNALKLYEELLFERENQKELNEFDKLDVLLCYTNILGIKTRKDFKGESNINEIKKMVKLVNNYLPLNQKSKFSPEVLSLHAESRIRGNRLQLFAKIEGLGLSKSDLVKDGIYAIKLLKNHLEAGAYPYLENDPIQDIRFIRKYMIKSHQN